MADVGGILSFVVAALLMCVRRTCHATVAAVVECDVDYCSRICSRATKVEETARREARPPQNISPIREGEPPGEPNIAFVKGSGRGYKLPLLLPLPIK
jgi:hypothetical protein